MRGVRRRRERVCTVLANLVKACVCSFIPSRRAELHAFINPFAFSNICLKRKRERFFLCKEEVQVIGHGSVFTTA